ncbi:MAG: citrate transporter [Lachnospiraceae bacterium]|nr:citrate transporter [Lachnospiraceae bacterium]
MQSIKEFVKKEIVLVVAVVLALVSMLFITPDREYINYIDFKTLSILFCLMAVMAGLQEVGVFQYVAEKLLLKVKRLWQLTMILVMLCFFFSMLITNDVALITFVPFAFIVLGLLGEEKERTLIIPVVVMQTIAANLGSMLTPIGNPQNLYLYGKAGLGLGEFLVLMLPYTVVAFVLLAGYCLYLGRSGAGAQKSKHAKVVDELHSERVPEQGTDKAQPSKSVATQNPTLEQPEIAVVFEQQTNLQGKGGAIAGYLLLFLLSLLTVARVLPYLITLCVVIIALLLCNRRLFAKIDYSLLFTFVGFFVFIGNMGRVPAFCNFLQGIIAGNEVLTAVVSSQVISNVPAALLLSGFTDNYEALILGTNLGGLGTLIASMASLISYKYIVKENKCGKGAYFGFFTITNIIFLIVLMLLWVCIG